MNIKDEYEKIYRITGFERIGLFDCLSKAYNIRSVIYLGSSIHIAPSFIFNDVTYLDNKKSVERLFNEKEQLRDYIDSRKTYLGKSNFCFVFDDYTRQNKFETKYDLAIAIYATNSLSISYKYIKKNGHILYLPLPSEEYRSCNIERSNVEGIIKYRNGRYEFEKNNMKLEKSIKKGKRGKTSLLFRETNEYLVLGEKT